MLRLLVLSLALSMATAQASIVTTNVTGIVPFNDADNVLGFGTSGTVSVDVTFSFTDSAPELIGSGDPNHGDYDALTTATAVVGGVHTIEYIFGPDPVGDISYYLNSPDDEILVLTFAHTASFTAGPLAGQTFPDGAFTVRFYGPAGTLQSDQLAPIPTTGWTSGFITIAGRVGGQATGLSICCNTTFTQISSMTVPDAPGDLIEELATLVVNTNIQAGIANSLDAKLDSALAALDDSNDKNDVAALNSMYAFCSSVEAQRGKKLTDAQADDLIAAANGVIGALDEFALFCE